ncbi:MAG: UvrD-helicase domain-containing protein [Bacteroidales bacterium]|nr:UvrD-helicase domain-containing protein [Candidatus Physcousia equi]
MNHVSIYKASAGSGKTFTLAVQYIRLLVTLHPLAFRHILAVTFTNKATAEMKERILEQLYGLANDLESSRGYMDALQRSLKEQGLELSEEALRRACSDALCYILHDYSLFRIETIDSFFQSVLRNLAHELGLNAHMQVDLNDKQMLNQAVDNLIDSLGRSLDGKKEMSGWIDDYVQRQIEDAEGWDVRGQIKALASIIFTDHYMKRDANFHAFINDEEKLIQFRQTIIEERETARKRMLWLVEALERSKNELCFSLPDVVSNGKWVEDYVAALVAGRFGEGKGMTDIRYARLSTPEELLKVAHRSNAAFRAQWAPFCQLLQQTEDERRVFSEVNNTVSLTLRNLSPLRLLSRVEEELTQITHDSHRFVLARTPILLSQMIGESDAPFVFEKMGTLFHHMMIDEFQDTSRLQWDNFKVLLQESHANGGNVLLVGDVKQSIYRFRGGDWRILKDIRQELHLPQEAVHSLDTNYRSDGRVIRFNNSFFIHAARLLDAEGEIGVAQEIYDDVCQKWRAGVEDAGYVSVKLCSDNEMENWKEWMLEDMCQQIEKLNKQGVPYEQMAILARTHKHTPEIIDFVQRRLGVKMLSDKGFQLAGSTALLMMVAALRMLVGKENDPVPERYLVKTYLTEVLHEEAEVADFLNRKTEDVLPKEFLTKMEELKHYPLFELCAQLYSLFHLEEVEANDAYVLAFFDELGAFLQLGHNDIHSFLEFWESDMKHHDIPQCRVDGISVLTIHKAKGLQYHTVFIPFCEGDLESHRPTDILWCDARKAPYDTLGALPLSGSQSQFQNSAYRQDFNEEQYQCRIEEFNNLYVAFTRAEHNLYVWGSMVRKKAANVARLLGAALDNFIYDDNDVSRDEAHGVLMLQQEELLREELTVGEVTHYEVGTPVGIAASSKEAQEENRMKPVYETRSSRFCSLNRRLAFRQSNEASKFMASRKGEEDIQRTTSFIEQGKLLHEIFSQLKKYDQLENVLADYQAQGIIKHGEELSHIRSLVEEGMKNPLVQRWFDNSYEVINECEIVHHDAELGEMVVHRPDRVMVGEHEVIVVDFKFGRKKSASYVTQVETYMQLIAEMYPEHTVSGYLWYVSEGVVEEVKNTR